MNEQPTKQFVTRNIPGFEDGTRLTMGAPANSLESLHSAFSQFTTILCAVREIRSGASIRVEIPMTPDALNLYVAITDIPIPGGLK